MLTARVFDLEQPRRMHDPVLPVHAPGLVDDLETALDRWASRAGDQRRTERARVVPGRHLAFIATRISTRPSSIRTA